MSTIERYLSVGSDALFKMQKILAMAGVEPKTILDYACGCGRVLRHLRHAYPEAEIVASDLMKYGTGFCADEFGAIPHTPAKDFSNVDFDQRFDLIWSGSLMTHIDEPAAREMISLFIRSLAPNGVAIWSTHGRYPASMYARGRWPYKLSKERMALITKSFERGQYGYADYDDMVGYGISMTPLPWFYDVLSTHDVRIVALTERGWDDHQDIVAIQNKPI